VARHSFAGAPVQTQLTGSIGPTDTTIPVESTSGWPDTATGEFVFVIVETAAEEKILASAYTSTSITVAERGYDGTVAASHDPGNDNVYPCLDAKQFDLHDEFVANNGSVTPDTSAIGDSAATGSSEWSAAADHQHGRESFATGATSSSAPADARNDGTSASPARADHKHARESIATLVADVSPDILGLPLALTGAVAATRYVGGTASGAPSTGSFLAGDFTIDQSGQIWVCTAPGSPGTWVAPFNTGAWTTYTPTWAGSGSNPAIGNGTLLGEYNKIGRQVSFRVYMLGGSSTTVGSGFYSFALPVATPSDAAEQVVACDFYDGANHYGATGLIAAGPATTVSPQSLKGGTGGEMVGLSSSSFSAGVGAVISLQGVYESAT
jgi:hypothetical protein